MEVGDETGGEFKTIGRTDKDIGLTGGGMQDALVVGASFQDPGSGGADGDNAFAGLLGLIESGGGIGVQTESLGVEFTGVEVFWSQGLESTETDVEGDEFGVDTLYTQFFEKDGGEV